MVHIRLRIVSLCLPDDFDSHAYVDGSKRLAKMIGIIHPIVSYSTGGVTGLPLFVWCDFREDVKLCDNLV